MEKSYLGNAFSLQMIETHPAVIVTREVDELPKGLESVVGHEDTARVLGVPYNRVSIKLGKGDTLYVAQLVGGRLPEGATSLPEGAEFKFIKITII